jgi:hypothetical protein
MIRLRITMSELFMRFSRTGLWSLTAALAVVLAAPQRAAAQSCTAGSFASYAIAGFSCQHGGLTFGGFTLVDFGPFAGNTVPDIDDLLVTPTSSAGGWVGFAFGPAITASGGALGVGQSNSVYFGINVDVTLPIGTQLRSTWTDPTATATGGLRSSAFAASIAYASQCFSSGLAGSSGNFLNYSSQGLELTTGTTVFATSCIASIFEVAVQGSSTPQPGQLGTASMSRYGFELLTPGVTVPEPATPTLLAAGLLLGMLARRHRATSR